MEVSYCQIIQAKLFQVHIWVFVWFLYFLSVSEYKGGTVQVQTLQMIRSSGRGDSKSESWSLSQNLHHIPPS